MSNLGHCKDNDKSKSGLRGAPLSTFVNKDFTLLSNECLIVFYEEKKMHKCKDVLEICRPISKGKKDDIFSPYF